MKKFTWHLRQAAQALGNLGLLGIGLLVLGCILQVVMIQPVKKEVAQLQYRLLSVKKYPPKINSFVPSQQLAQIYAFFPQSSMLSEQLKTLHQITDANALNLGKVDYKLSRVSGTSLERYDISYAITTDYPTLRRYISDLLNELPNAALDSVELQRANDASEVPEAQLNIVLYYREQS